MNKREKMLEILKSHDIELKIKSCGCCNGTQVTFSYKGELIIDEEEEFKKLYSKEFCVNDTTTADTQNLKLRVNAER